MVQETLNIFNLFPAQAAKPEGALSSGTPTSEGQDSFLFGDILGIALGEQASSSLVDPDKMLPIMTNDEGDEQTTPALIADATDSEVASEELVIPSLLLNSAPESTLEQVVEGKAKPQQVAEPKSELALPNSLTTNRINEMIQSTSLESGKYQILDFKESGKDVSLKLASLRSDGSDEIEVTVPRELISRMVVDEKTLARTDVTLSREQAVNARTGSTYNSIDQLFSDLKLTSLEVTETNKSSEKLAGEEFKIRLTGEQGGKVVVSEGIAAQQLLRARRVLSQNNGKANRISLDLSGKEQVDEKGLQGKPGMLSDMPSDGNDKPSIGSHKVMNQSSRHSGSFNLPDILENGMQTADDIARSINDTMSVERTARTEGTNSNIFAKRVRFVLPENLGQHLKPNGQAIMIRVEPDNLGPAKLHLTMRGESLIARITVHSPQAQAAVEHSLEQLNQQLSKAGIEVERIDVSLSGNGQHQQFFDRDADWHQSRMKQSRLAGGEIEQISNEIPVLSEHYQREYIASTSVNMYA